MFKDFYAQPDQLSSRLYSEIKKLWESIPKLLCEVSKNQLRNSKTLIHSLRFRDLLRLKGMVEGTGEEERGFETVEGDSREWLKEAVVMEAEGEGGGGDGGGS
ncbi:hypothetical protein RIF29_23846 [Crotalaria pallida]|uniref:Uncharacterized protein n=1 Tax=Crotalaria pallida TaxID=3830 RepID=A0AAN9EQS5_CROPI